MSDAARETTTESKENHGGSGGGPAIAEPTHEVESGRRRTPGEEARTLVAAANSGALGATCEAIDRYGVDLRVQTPRGQAPVRVGFAQPARSPGDLRAATVALARAARAWTGEVDGGR
jgi:Protein of unknown function (DUF2470)